MITVNATHPDEQFLQAWMIERAARELEVDPSTIDPTSGLMTLGFDSLALIGLAGELAELLNCELPAEVLWELNSIQAVARYLAELADVNASAATVAPNSYFAAANVWSPVRPLQPNGSRRPLFVVHGLTGTTHEYERFVGPLGNDLPLFGLNQPPDLPPTIGEMARLLIDAIRTVQRKGPYRLFGFCFGGALAYEVACQLSQGGDKVEFLGMFDTPWSGEWSSLQQHQSIGLPAVTLASAATAAAYLAWESARTPRKTYGRVKGRLAYWSHLVRRRKGLTDQAVSNQWVSEFWTGCQAAARHNGNAFLAYRPRPYSGRLTLFLTKEQRMLHALATWRWTKAAAGGAEYINISGGHDGIQCEHVMAECAAHIAPRLT